MSDHAFLNPQPLPPARFGPGDPMPWRGLATGVMVAASLEAAARQAGDERLGGLAAQLIDDLCPPPFRFPIPPPPPWWYMGFAVELLGMTATMPESAARDAVLGRVQTIVGHAAARQRPG